MRRILFYFFSSVEREMISVDDNNLSSSFKGRDDLRMGKRFWAVQRGDLGTVEGENRPGQRFISKTFSALKDAVFSSSTSTDRTSNRTSNNSISRFLSIADDESNTRYSMVSTGNSNRSLAMYRALRLSFYIVMWYVCSALTNNLNKIILKETRDAVVLTLVQFGITAICSGIYLLIASTRVVDSGDDDAGGFVSKSTSKWDHIVFLCKSVISRKIIYAVGPLTLFSLASHITTSMAISMIPVSFVHTIKGSAPLFTVIISRYFLSIRYSDQVYSSLFPLTLGIVLACWQDLSFHYAGFLTALLSTIIIVVQNISNKRLFQKSALDTSHFVFYLSALSFILLLPMVALYRSKNIFSSTTLFTSLSSSSSTSLSLSSSLSLSLSSSTSTSTSTSTLYLIWQFTLNGITHYGQNVFAVSVLHLVNPVTYSIASLGKRLIVITASIIYLGEDIKWTKITGIALSLYGIYLYNRARLEDNRKESPTLPHSASSLAINATKSNDENVH